MVAKGSFSLQSKLPPAYQDQSTAHSGGFTLSFFVAEYQKANINFYSLWFDPTRMKRESTDSDA